MHIKRIDEMGKYPVTRMSECPELFPKFGKAVEESMSSDEVPESRIRKCLRGLDRFIEDEWLETVKALARNNDAAGLERNNISDGRSEYYTRLTPYGFCIDVAYRQARFPIVVNNWSDMSKKELIDELQKSANRNLEMRGF